MLRIRILVGLLVCFFSTVTAQINVSKKVLSNGLVVLVRPIKTMQKVSVHMRYNVGSKDEETGERGLAHLLEHMVFKGTGELSESDIPLVTRKLSGYCNAYTTSDETNYLFDLPVQHWDEALPILADCMRNCTFKQDLLNAEFKVVIQELKRNKDNLGRALAEKMSTALFEDHPYHYPIGGYKQDLWTVKSSNLHGFYKKHYIPNNAVLVVVGNVDPEDVFAKAQRHFGSIKPDKNYRKEKFYCNQDLSTQDITLYRDVKSSTVALAFIIPGLRDRSNYMLDVFLNSLCGGKSSRLPKKIVEDKRLANWIQVSTLDRPEHDVLFFRFEPRRLEDVEEVARIVQEELSLVAQNGLLEEELGRAVTQINIDFYSLMESNHAQADFIGRYFLALGDENYINHYNSVELSALNDEIKSFVSHYCTPFRMHKGKILPFDAKGQEQWQLLQKLSDLEDVKFLKERERKSNVEPVKYAHRIKAKAPVSTTVTKPDSFDMANGLHVITQANTVVPKIEVALELKATRAYDPADRQGLYRILCEMMGEGTEKYPGVTLAKEFDDNGISISYEPGFIHMSMLSSKFEKGLELLGEILSRATLEDEALTKVKQWEYAAYQRFLDSPEAIAQQLAREKVYGNHPYGKRVVPNSETIDAVTKDELLVWYRKVISPRGARLAVVGDIGQYDVPALLEKNLGSWTGQEPEDLVYPEIAATQFEKINYTMDRDQIVLKFAGLSVSRNHPDFDALLLFGQLLSGMSSRLFKLRMEYGFFYSAQGSLVAGSDQQPGMVTLSTMVSKDRVEQAEQLFNHLIDTVADTITASELEEAKQVLINSTADFYSTSGSIADVLLFLHRYGLPHDYFSTRASILSSISVDQVKTAVKKVLRRDKMAVIKVGRVN